MVLIEHKSQMEVECIVLGKKKCPGTLNRWIREYISRKAKKIVLKRKKFMLKYN